MYGEVSRKSDTNYLGTVEKFTEDAKKFKFVTSDAAAAV